MITADQAKKNVEKAQKTGLKNALESIDRVSKSGGRYTFSDVLLLEEDIKTLKTQGFKVTSDSNQNKIEW